MTGFAKMINSHDRAMGAVRLPLDVRLLEICRAAAKRSALVVLVCFFMAACSSGPKIATVDKKYGVTASPRVAETHKPIPRGGGRRQVGKPYKIAGRWYHPKEDPNYSRIGQASWYGEAFHGRLTANGEIFDMNTLSAAHTTMPLPSYARVTNLDNGRSVIVRVNDRGPFAHDREIDLSKRTAEVLDFKHKGLARVKVDYVGRARLDGQDKAFLLASVRGPGERPATLLAGVNTLPSGPVPAPITRPYLVDGNPFDPSVYTALASTDPVGQGRLPRFGQSLGSVSPDEEAIRTAALYFSADRRVSDAHRMLDRVAGAGAEAIQTHSHSQLFRPAICGYADADKVRWYHLASYTDFETAAAFVDRAALMGQPHLEAVAGNGSDTALRLAVCQNVRTKTDKAVLSLAQRMGFKGAHALANR